MFRKTYFIRSTNYAEDGSVIKSSWQCTETNFSTKPVFLLNEYRHERENELGGRCMIDEFRRIE
jgi:hypothetical protein